jgi:hypothetical protein
MLLPWPSLFLVTCLSLFLSVVCRSVMQANVVLVVSLFVILLVHALSWHVFAQVCEGYAVLLENTNPGMRFPTIMSGHILWLMGLHQTLILLFALIFAALAFRCFSRKTSEVRTQVW